MPSLRILTLNCWSIPIPLLCKDRKERIQSIAESLSTDDYDVVLLQEIWSPSDYNFISQVTATNFPHSHYFHSGAIGSGMCIFSRFPIKDTHYLQFHLNGYAHKLLHGDWFGGKGVGLVKLDMNGLNINVYVTHIHAEYNRVDDEYRGHRLIQSFQLSQFVKHTSESCDLVIVGGDFNMDSSYLSYKLILANAMLCDTWNKKKRVSGDHYGYGCTDETPTNSYTSSSSLEKYPYGRRIDFIFYRTNAGCQATVESCQTVMGRIPGKNINYSDHEGVTSNLTITHSPTAQSCPAMDLPVLCDLLKEVEVVFKKSIEDLQLIRLFWIVLALLSGLSLCVMSTSQAYTDGLYLVMILVKGIIIVALAISIWTGIIIVMIEKKGYISAKLEIGFLMKAKKTN